MANNPYVNKVQLADGTTVMDISDTTAGTGDVLSSKVFYTASGTRSTGTLDLGVFVAVYGTTTLADVEAAYTAQKVIVCYRADNNTMYAFTKYTGSAYYFRSMGSSNNICYGVYVDSSGWHANSYTYVLVAQGSGNAGKVMVVNSSGNVEAGSASTALSISLVSGSWSSATPPTQTVTATGVTASNHVIIGYDAAITSSQYDELCAAKIVCTAQASNSLTFTCYGTEPTGNIPLSVVILG